MHTKGQRYEITEARATMWAQAKGIFREGTISGQLKKLNEELGELIDGLATDNEIGVKDSIGDMLVVLNNVANMKNLDLVECFEEAVDEIANRPGRMVGGVFVKDE